MSRTYRTAINLDPVLFCSVLILLGLGALMVSSASVAEATAEAGDVYYFFIRHLVAIAIGMAGLVTALYMPIEWWNRAATLLLAAALTFLVLVLIPAFSDRINGARRWIDFGPIGFQASELARLFLLVYLSSYAVRHHAALRAGISGFARPMLLIGLASFLLIREPDHGAAAVLVATSLGVLFIAGARLRDLLLTGLAAVVCMKVAVSASAYVQERIDSWKDPFLYQYDGGYQLVNSLIATGSGTWFGAGLGQSVQKMFYLPDAHTDFIFAILAEELGLIGATGVIFLFGVLVYRGFSLSRRAIDLQMPFHAVLSASIVLMLGMQAVISMCVNTGLLPTTGLTLPLISYGKTSMVVTMLALGILFRVSHEVSAATAGGKPRSGR